MCIPWKSGFNAHFYQQRKLLEDFLVFAAITAFILNCRRDEQGMRDCRDGAMWVMDSKLHHVNTKAIQAAPGEG